MNHTHDSKFDYSQVISICRGFSNRANRIYPIQESSACQQCSPDELEPLNRLSPQVYVLLIELGPFSPSGVIDGYSLHPSMC